MLALRKFGPVDTTPTTGARSKRYASNYQRMKWGEHFLSHSYNFIPPHLQYDWKVSLKTKKNSSKSNFFVPFSLRLNKSKRHFQFPCSNQDSGFLFVLSPRRWIFVIWSIGWRMNRDKRKKTNQTLILPSKCLDLSKAGWKIGLVGCCCY